GELQRVAAIEREQPHLFVLEPREPGVRPGDHLRVPAHRQAHAAERADVHPPPELERGREAGGFRRPNAPALREPVRSAARDRLEGALALEQAGSEHARGLTAGARAEDEREQVDVWQGFHALAEGAFTAVRHADGKSTARAGAVSRLRRRARGGGPWRPTGEARRASLHA